MKDEIIFLDAGTVDFGDIPFEELQALGNFKAYHHTEASQILSRVRNARFVVTNKYEFGRALLGRLRGVECLCITATGVNNVDLKAAQKLGIAVANVRGYSTESVVQTTFAFILALACNLLGYNEKCHNGSWSESPFFTMGSYPIREIWGKTLGIIGYGAIGRRVAEAARAFGMRTLIARIPGRGYPKEERMKRTSFGAVIRRADFLSIHAPLTDLTRNLIDGAVIRKMKRGAFLINVARGGIVDEKALSRALYSGHLAGGATDVLTAEPPPRNHVLMKAPRFLMTPHVAWASREARARLIHEVALNIRAFQQGRRRNRVV